LSAALALAPNNLNIRNNIALLLMNSDQPEPAAEQFRLILRMDSTFTGAKENLRRAEAMMNQ
jgi:thioredoxin-like negative regulator of GroEL